MDVTKKRLHSFFSKLPIGKPKLCCLVEKEKKRFVRPVLELGPVEALFPGY